MQKEEGSLIMFKLSDFLESHGPEIIEYTQQDLQLDRVESIYSMTFGKFINFSQPSIP